MKANMEIVQVNVNDLKPADYNPRKWNEKAVSDLKESIKRFGLVDPIIVNNAKGREGIIIGGHFRWHVAKDLGFTEVPVVYISIPDLEKEMELNVRLNKNVGEFDFDLLANFNNELLLDAGFTSTELDTGFGLGFDGEDEGGGKNLETETIKFKFPNVRAGEIKEALKNAKESMGVDTLEEVLESLLNEYMETE